MAPPKQRGQFHPFLTCRRRLEVFIEPELELPIRHCPPTVVLPDLTYV